MNSPLARTAFRSLWVSFQPQEQGLLLKILKETPPGGVIFFRRHFRSKEELIELLSAILKAAQAPLVTALDEEGGEVRRLPPDLPAFPAPRVWGGYPPQELERASALLGGLLRSLGFSLNLAPVVDSCEGEPSPLLRTRLFHPDPEHALPYIRAFLQGMKSAGIATCLKHFPNHGLTREDSHETLPRITLPFDAVAPRSFLPFREGIGLGAETVMLAHLLWEAVDPRHPMSMSPRAVELLRKELAFPGVILSDDMDMEAMRSYPREDLLVEAIVNGVNGVLFCQALEPVLPAVELLIREGERSPALRRRLQENAERLRTLPPPQLPERVQVEVLARTLFQEVADKPLIPLHTSESPNL